MESEVRVKAFSEEIAGQEVNFYILCMKQSFMLWVGADASFSTLAVAMNTRYVCTPYQLVMYKVLYRCVSPGKGSSKYTIVRRCR